MKLHLPAQVRAATFEPTKIDIEKRTAEVVWTTGAAVRRIDFWTGRAWMEELSMDPSSVRLDRLRSGAPLLDSHISWGARNILGVVESASLDGKEGRATVRFSPRAEVDPIWQDVQAGIIRNISVGYAVYRMKDVTKGDAEVKTLRAVDWEPLELSVVAVPADPGAGFRSNDTRFECEVEEGFAEVGAAGEAKRGWDLNVLLAINNSKQRSIR